MLTLAALSANMLLRKALGERTLEEAATRVTEIQPSETEQIAPPLALANQVGKATGATDWTPLDAEIAAMLSSTLFHAPVLKYEIDTVLVHGAGFDAPYCSFRKRATTRSDLLALKVGNCRSATYCMTAASDRYFGHWLMDACSTALLRDPATDLILDRRDDWPHAAEFLSAFDLQPSDPGAKLVRTLTVYSDVGQGSNKRARYELLRQRAKAAFGDGLDRPRSIYFRRGQTGVSRMINNDSAVCAALANIGFTVFDLDGAKAIDIYHAFQRADLVVSMDGSHLNHLYFAMPRGSTLLTIIPSDRFTANQVGYATAVGLRYGYLVGDAAGPGCVVNIPELLSTIDLVNNSKHTASTSVRLS